MSKSDLLSFHSHPQTASPLVFPISGLDPWPSFPSRPPTQGFSMPLGFYPKYTLNRSISFHLQGYHASPSHPFCPLFPPMVYSPHSNQKDLFNVRHTLSLSCLQPCNNFPMLSTAYKVLRGGPGSIFLTSWHAVLGSSPQTWEVQVHTISPSRPLYLQFHVSRTLFATFFACWFFFIKCHLIDLPNHPM